MKRATLAIVLRGSQVLLGYKKKGEIGTGTLNGPGGKVESNESLLQCVVRETREECGIELSPKHLDLVAIIKFFAAEVPDFEVFIYRTSVFKGEPKETADMTPAWFDIDNLPLDRMLESDRMWFKDAITSSRRTVFGANVYYKERAKDFDRIEFRKLP